MATYILRVVHEYISLHNAASEKKNRSVSKYDYHRDLANRHKSDTCCNQLSSLQYMLIVFIGCLMAL